MSYGTDIQRLMLALDELREANETMQFQQAQILLLVALKPGITAYEVIQATGASQASVSRNLATLAKHGPGGKAGLDLVKAQKDDHDHRQMRHFLTARGTLRVQKVLRALGSEEAAKAASPAA